MVENIMKNKLAEYTRCPAKFDFMIQRMVSGSLKSNESFTPSEEVIGPSVVDFYGLDITSLAYAYHDLHHLMNNHPLSYMNLLAFTTLGFYNYWLKERVPWYMEITLAVGYLIAIEFKMKLARENMKGDTLEETNANLVQDTTTVGVENLL